MTFERKNYAMLPPLVSRIAFHLFAHKLSRCFSRLLTIGALISYAALASAVEPMISAGFDTAINMLHTDGTVWTFTNKSAPSAAKMVRYPRLDKIVAIAGDIALREDGTVWELHQYCRRPKDEYDWHCFPRQSVKVDGIDGVVEIAADRDNFRVARKADGSVWVWSIVTFDAGEFGIPPHHVKMLREAPQDYLYPNVKVTGGFFNDLGHWIPWSYLKFKKDRKIVGPKRLDFLPEVVGISVACDIAIAMGKDQTLYLWGTFRSVPSASCPARHPPSGEFVTGAEGRSALRVSQFTGAKQLRLWRSYVLVDGLETYYMPERSDDHGKVAPRFQPMSHVTDVSKAEGSIFLAHGEVVVGSEVLSASDPYRRIALSFPSRPKIVAVGGYGLDYALLEDGSVYAWSSRTHFSGLNPQSAPVTTDRGVPVNLFKPFPQPPAHKR